MRRYLPLFLALAFLTAGCTSQVRLGFSLADPQVSQVHNQGAILVLQDPAHAFTQSFTAPNPGLDSLTIWVTGPTEGARDGLLTVTLYAGGNPVPFYNASFAAQQFSENSPLRLAFEPRADPPGETYTLKLSAEGGPFELRGRTEDIYGGGMAALDGIPLNADLAFETTYAYTFTALEQDLRRFGGDLRLLLPLFVVLILPGWLLLEVTGLRRRFDFWENAALAAGISLALLPVLMLWTTLLTFPWRAAGVWAAAMAAAALLLATLISRRAEFKLSLPSTTIVVMGVILALSCGLRLVMARDMVAPAWVDSIHHALLGRLVAEAGAYPASFLPFFELEPTRYHPGFHVSLAALMQLSGLDSARALLVLGQVLNMLAPLSAYLFTTTLTKDKRAGAAAALAVAFFSPMPAYYTSWGRYTQLAGMLVLPAPLALWRGWIERKEAQKGDWAYPLLTAVAMGGLFLVHYRVAAFAGLLLLPDWLASLFRHGKQSVRFALFSGLPALVLTFPWLLPALTRTLLPEASLPVTPGAEFMADFPWGNLTAHHGKYLLYLAGAAIPVGLWQRERIAVLLPVWVGLLLVLANLGALDLPGSTLVNNTAVAISLYLPVAALVGMLAAQAIRLGEKALPAHQHATGASLLVLATLALSLVGWRQMVGILNPNLYLVRPADLTAIQWAQENLPEGETVLVNPFLWGYGWYAGGDGGYYLSALAGLPTLPPPVLHGMERAEEAFARNDLSEELIALAPHPAELSTLLQSHGIRYLFLGARGGPLSPSLLQQSGLFERLYANEGVYIFRLNQGPGE